MRLLSAVVALIFAVCAATPSFADPTPVSVDLELSLVVDVSGSVDNNEYELQVQGYVNAFNNSTIQALFEGPNAVAVAVNMIMFAQDAIEIVPWTLIDSSTAAADFATAISLFADSDDRPDRHWHFHRYRRWGHFGCFWYQL